MEQSLSNAHKAFLNFTHAKRRECFKDFTEGQSDAYNIIPYLLHTSEPKRFGYVHGQCAPFGIHGYKYNEAIKTLGRKYFSSKDKFEDPKVFENAPIESLSIMGSAGSIAQTEGSDLDYWVTVHPKIKGDKLNLLQRKLSSIEKWCWDELDAEVHFFISTAEDIRKNNFGTVDKESCGTALGKLLKEEYYRTSLHIMGKIPYWWMAPYNGNDVAYGQTIDDIKKDASIESNDFIDFGNIRSIPSDEFVGGGMWQLNKGIGSPFKSALKMGLLVEYADESAPRDLLAQMLKRRMHENPGDMDALDPYVMMIERVLDYFRENGSEEDVSLLQQCLFIKMNISIFRWWDSKVLPNHRTPATLLKMVRKWGWSSSDVKKWEHFDDLPMSELTRFKRNLERFMFESLQKLRSSASENRAVSEEDFKKMTQRLATIFNPNPKRTEWFYAPYDKMIRSRVYSIQEEAGDKTWMWNLYTGLIDAEGQLSKFSSKKQLNSCASLPDLVTWMCYNQLVKIDGKIFIQHRRDIPFSGNLKRLGEAYREHIGKPKLPTLDSDVFAKDSIPVKWLIVVNLVPIINVEELEDDEEDSGHQQRAPSSSLIAGELAEALQEAGYSEKATEMKEASSSINESDDIIDLGGKNIPIRAGRLPVDQDPFNAGEEACSIFHELFIIELNSWGEVFTHKLKGNNPVVQAISSMVGLHLKHPNLNLDLKVELGFGPYHQKHVRTRFIKMMEDTTKSLIQSRAATAASLFQMDGKYISIIRFQDRVEPFQHDSFPESIHHVNMMAKGTLELFFDSEHPRIAQHRQIYDEGVRGENTVTLLESGEGILITFVDQSGRYFYDAVTKNDFGLQWGPFLLSVLSSVKQEDHRKKLSIHRVTKKEKQDITQQTLKRFLEIRKSLPRTQMNITALEGERWMKKKESASVLNELQEAIGVHGDKGDFIVSSVIVDSKSASRVTWTPCIALQLRQKLIRTGRRMMNTKRSS